MFLVHLNRIPYVGVVHTQQCMEMNFTLDFLFSFEQALSHYHPVGTTVNILFCFKELLTDLFIVNGKQSIVSDCAKVKIAIRAIFCAFLE